MLSFPKVSLCIIVFNLVSLLGYAQSPPAGVGGGNFGSTQSEVRPQEEYVPEEIDTSGVFYKYIDNPFQEVPFKDSLIDNFQTYDPIKQRDLEYANLGNVGSAHRPLFFQSFFRKGFDIGLHQFDLYQITPETTPYYRIKNAYSRAYYSQGQGNQNLIFKGEYSRRFKNGTVFSVDYKRMNHEGQYKSQRAKNTAFATSWWFPHKNGKYDGFLSYNSNTILQQDNGGIIPELVTEQNQVDPFSLQVNLNQVANTQFVQREYTYTHYYNLVGGVKKRPAGNQEKPPFDILRGKPPVDSLGRPLFSKDSLAIPITILTSDSIIQDSIVMDSLGKRNPFLIDSLKNKSIQPPISKDSLAIPITIVTSDSIIQDSIVMDSLGKRNPILVDSLKNKPIQPPVFIPDGPPKRAFLLSHQISLKKGTYKFSDTNPDTSYYQNFAVHRGGLRHFVGYKKWENSFRVSTERSRDDGNELRSQKDWLEAGITHSFYKINQEPSDTILHNLFVHGRWHFTPSERLKVKTYAHYGLLANGGDYRLNGDLFFDFKKVGSLKIEAIHQHYAPSLLQSRLYLSKVLVWENNFNKIFETSLSATYKLPSFRFEITGRYHLINNFIYYNTEGIPQQTGTAINVGQLILKKDITVGPFHLLNTVILQQSPDEFLRLPQFYLKHSLFFEGPLFKKLLFARIGVDFRLNNEFRPDIYQPAIGQFHLQDEQTAPLYPALDAFLSFKVDKFRFFIKYENIMNAFDQSEFYILTTNYPERYAAMRFGVSWQFVN